MIMNKNAKADSRIRDTFQVAMKLSQDRLKCMDLNQIEELLLAFDIIIQARQGNAARTADVANGGAFVALLGENASGMPENHIQLPGSDSRVWCRGTRHSLAILSRTFVRITSIVARMAGVKRHHSG